MKIATYAIALICMGCALDERSITRSSTAASETHLSEKDKLDIYEAVVRHRLSKAPLARGRRLNLYINWGAPAGLARRFPEYRTSVMTGDRGNSPPPERYYFILLGRATGSDVWLMLEEERVGLSIRLTKRGGRWLVTDEHPNILT